jgi:hypothetical protein
MLPFHSSNCEVEVFPGDQVECNVAVHKRSKARSGVRIKLVKEADLPRERGVVISLKDARGFVRSINNLHDLYFDIRGNDLASRIKLGMLVEFFVLSGSKEKKSQLRAIRLVEISEETAFKRSSAKAAKEIKEGVIALFSKGTVTYVESDLGSPDLSLRKGETVEFSIALDKRNKTTRRATNIRRLREQGVVITCRDSRGKIRRSEFPEEPPIFFSMKDVC